MGVKKILNDVLSEISLSESEVSLLKASASEAVKKISSGKVKAFVGGSLIDHGGQNLLEPAAIGLPITSGPSLRNFQEVATELENAGGLTIVNSSNELIKTFINFIEQEGRKEESGEASKEVFLKNRGSLEKIRSKLIPALNKIL